MAVANPPTSVSVALAGSNITVSWVPGGNSYQTIEVSRWDHVSRTWTVRDTFSAKPPPEGIERTTWTDTGVSNNRLFLYRVRAKNADGWSSSTNSDNIQTYPASPTGASVTKSGANSALVKWTNGASTTGGYMFATEVERSVNGGAWSKVAQVPSSTTSWNFTGGTPGTTYAFRVRARSDVGAATVSGYSTTGSVTMTAVPASPSGLAGTFTSDTQTSIAWTNNPATNAPYDSITVQRFQVSTQTWATIATLAGTAASYTDTSTVANEGYQWRIRANNEAGSSAWVTSNTHQTTPAAPSGLMVKGGGTSVTFAWANNTPANGTYTITLRYYKDGVLSGTATLDGATVAYLANGTTPASAYKFDVKVNSSVGRSTASPVVTSAEVLAATTPNAPSNLAPAGVTVDAVRGPLFTWKHNPSADNSDQTKFEIQYSVNDGASFTSLGVQASSQSKFQTPASTLANGHDIQWQVRTWGASATASPWSSISTFSTSATPTVTIASPGTAVNSSAVNASWSYSDAESTPQSAFEIQLFDIDGNVLESQSGTGTFTSFALHTVFQDSTDYSLKIRAADSSGLWSDWATVFFHVSFTPPAASTLQVEYATDTGAMVLSLSPGTVGTGTVAAVSCDIQRRLREPTTGQWGDWLTIATGIAPDATIIDTEAPIVQDGQYRVITYSAIPSSVTGDPVDPSGSEDRWVYLSGGPNFTQVCRLEGNVSVAFTTSRDRQLYNFAGRMKPVMYASDARNRQTDVAGLLDSESSQPAEWEALVSYSDVLLLRDPLGHRSYCSVPEVQIAFLGNDLYSIQFTATEVEYP